MNTKKKLVISTGAGISAESGISTFRDSGGLWEQYPVMDVASHDGFVKNPELVHKFYNERRKQLLNVEPNAGHRGLVTLEQWYDTHIITQNVDNLHERAGSSNVLHLHGELMKVRSLNDENKIYSLSDDNLETSPSTTINGDYIRPHIVFFQEPVPMIERAIEIVQEADIYVVIGTSLVVYPAAGLMHYLRQEAEVYYIDPNPAEVPSWVTVLKMGASEGVAKLIEKLRP